MWNSKHLEKTLTQHIGTIEYFLNYNMIKYYHVIRYKSKILKKTKSLIKYVHIVPRPDFFNGNSIKNQNTSSNIAHSQIAHRRYQEFQTKKKSTFQQSISHFRQHRTFRNMHKNRLCANACVCRTLLGCVTHGGLYFYSWPRHRYADTSPSLKNYSVI